MRVTSYLHVLTEKPLVQLTGFQSLICRLKLIPLHALMYCALDPSPQVPEAKKILEGALKAGVNFFGQ